MKQLNALIIKNEEMVPGIFRIWLKAPELVQEARPGRFVMIRCGEDLLLRRPFSIHRVEEDNVAVLFQIRGKGTEWLTRCKKGDYLDVFGAMGNGFEILPGSKNLLLVAGGMGIAPLFYVAESAIRKGNSVAILLGAPTSRRLYPINQLPPGVKIVLATDDGSAGQKGTVTELIPRFNSSLDQIFACGPLQMLRHMAEEQERLGIKGKFVQVSMETRMGCGVGVCYSCTIRTKDGLKQVCSDGPIFNLNEIVWDELIKI
jgi:dihydroorotate dehydrogenase electron transfer subunit